MPVLSKLSFFHNVFKSCLPLWYRKAPICEKLFILKMSSKSALSAFGTPRPISVPYIQDEVCRDFPNALSA